MSIDASNNSLPNAPGAPGIEPHWSSSAKDGIGTAYHTGCRLWFTLSEGVVTELFFPTVDTPNTRDLQLLISDGSTFCHEERRDLNHSVEMPHVGALFYRVINSERSGRYRIIKEVLTDPHRSTLLLNCRLEISDPSLVGKLRVYVLLAPHIGNQGKGNSASIYDRGGRALLTANRENIHLVLGCNKGFSKRSAGYVGASDGWQDLMKGNFQMDWQFSHAKDGNVALTGQIDLHEDDNEFILGVGFGNSLVSATTELFQSFARPFSYHKEGYLSQWRQVTENPEIGKEIVEKTGDGGKVWASSRSVLMAHEDKTFQGAMVASVSTPWGETKPDSDSGGYHLVWTRDLVQSASALLAIGNRETPLHALIWLTCIQNPDGSFPQNSWIDGEPYWQGIQLDEMAAPMLLGWRIWRYSPSDYDHSLFRPVIAASNAYLIGAGPVTEQDRWEESGGYSPLTIGTIIAALCAGADLASKNGFDGPAEFSLVYADWLNAHLEEWTVTTKGELLPGKPRHYIRITPVTDTKLPETHPDPDTEQIQLPHSKTTYAARNVVGGDFLHLVRLGIRPADDPLILDSIEVMDSVLKRNLPQGPGWRRYPHDQYGQKDDGGPFDTNGGVGRSWPLLTGERGHYELAAGRDPKPYIAAMERFANSTGMIPEQIWDAPDLPDTPMKEGRPSGSAMPLCWSHAEYLTLVRSAKDGTGFDRIDPAWQRYVVGRKRTCTHEIWTLRHRTRRIPAGRILRLVFPSVTMVRWTAQNWSSWKDEPANCAGYGNLFYLDIPTQGLQIGTVLSWTFQWQENGNWAGENFSAEIVQETMGPLP